MVGDELRETGEETRTLAALVVGELVTEAYQAAAGAITVEVWVHHGVARVTVTGATRWPWMPAGAPGDPVAGSAPTVEAVAGRLEVELFPQEHVVTFDVRLPTGGGACGCRGCACGP